MFGVPIAVLVGVLVVAGAGVLWVLFRSVGASRRRARQAPHGVADAVPAARGAVRVSTPAAPGADVPLARPGVRGPLFQYGGNGPGVELDAPFAVVAVQTTGFAADAGDRVVEVAVARVDARGRIYDEYATLVDPGRDVGPIFAHGIHGSDVRDAPTFAEIAGELLARLDGAVVVAHNAAVEERFLAAEFARIGVVLPMNPALCSLGLARRTLRPVNDRLTTLARTAGLPVPGGHGALSDVRTVAGLLPQLLALHGEAPRFLTGTRALPDLPGDADAKPRILEHRLPGAGTWLASLIGRLPLSAAEGRSADAQRYLDTLALALAEGRIVGGEGQALTRLARTAGLDEAEVLSLHRRFLEHLRVVAQQSAILTTAEIRQLKTAASGLGLPGFFDELRPTSPQDLLTARGTQERVLAG